MQKKKYISIVLCGAMFLQANTASAMMLPSLYSQMESQKVIDKELHKYRIDSSNDAKLAEIRAKNQARMQWLQNANVSLPSDSQEKQLNESARQAALARPVYRQPLQVVSSNADTYSSASTNVTFSPSLNSSRTHGNIDMRRVEQAWLDWVNELRSEKGLSPYMVNDALNQTAQEWAEFSRDRGYTTHGRPGDGCIGETNYGCYNFSVIDQWFKDRGVNPVVINRSKHTENVGFGSFRCKSLDCTDAAINAIRKTFNFFHSEKSYNGVHYKSMVHANFKYMGLGFAEKNGTYYLTIHYSNELK